MDMDQDQRDCLAEAVKLLHPKSDAERLRCEMEVGWLLMWYRRQDRKPQPAKARQDIDDLQKQLKRTATTLERLDPLAYVNLFTPENLKWFRGATGFGLVKILNEIEEACPKAKRDIVLNLKGGRPKNWAKRDLVRNCLHLFEKERPREAKPNSEDFLVFCDTVYSAASGQRDVDLDFFILEAFRQFGQLTTELPE